MSAFALLPDLKLPKIATRDVGDYAAQRPLGPFSDKQTRELLGEHDLSMVEPTAVHIEMFQAINAGVLAPSKAFGTAGGFQTASENDH